MSLSNLADELEVPAATLKRYLARTFPGASPGRGKPWAVSEEMAKSAWWHYIGRKLQ